MRARTDRLQRAGLSAAKIRTVKVIARAVTDGAIDFNALAAMPADDARNAVMTAVHGIGPWTTDLYLLSCVGHGDAWPAGDLALQEAARLAFVVSSPTDGEADDRHGGKLWRPWWW